MLSLWEQYKLLITFLQQKIIDNLKTKDNFILIINIFYKLNLRQKETGESQEKYLKSNIIYLNISFYLATHQIYIYIYIFDEWLDKN